MIIVKQSATLLAYTPDPEELIAKCGRVCYQSEGTSSTRDFINRLLQREHLSVLEHASATISFICDRGVSHELVRHRLASYSHESTRYCNYQTAGQIEFICPDGVSNTPNNLMFRLWKESVELAERTYLEMVASGLAPQVARSVLPNSLRTQIIMTANFREWLHFLKLRTAPAAHPMMREIAGLAGRCLDSIAPTVFGAYRGYQA